MSVLIKGMDMPNSCYDCQLAYDCIKCIVTGTSFIWDGAVRKDFSPETDRLPDCPLVAYAKKVRTRSEHGSKLPT